MVLSAAGLERAVGARVLWRGFSLELRRGESVALTGPSGSGKTVLLRTLAGLEPVEAGEVTLDGRSQRDWRMPAFRARVSYLSQRPVLFEGSVLDNLRRPFALRIHRDRRFDPDRALSLLARLGRDDVFLSQQGANLSGGEGQIVALVRVLLVEPTVLLLDEATASLDPDATRRVEALIADWRRESRERACLWVSHDPAQLGRVATRSVSLRDEWGVTA
ncbi:MAG: ATP-binding cassette domain-containing protein [Myxococcaceae bacterium]